MEFESHSFPYVNGGLESLIIILSDDSKMEESSREFISDEALSMKTSESLFHMKPHGGKNLAKGPMSPPVLIDTEIEDEGNGNTRKGE